MRRRDFIQKMGALIAAPTAIAATSIPCASACVRGTHRWNITTYRCERCGLSTFEWINELGARAASPDGELAVVV